MLFTTGSAVCLQLLIWFIISLQWLDGKWDAILGIPHQCKGLGLTKEFKVNTTSVPLLCCHEVTEYGPLVSPICNWLCKKQRV